MQRLRRKPVSTPLHRAVACPLPDRLRRSRQSGVTLTGLVVGMGVGTLVLSGGFSVYLMIAQGARENLQQARLSQELRAALEVMQQDIRRAGHWDFADTNGDGDANGDGLFAWDDLGTHEDGSGTFDANGDGDTDDWDLDPVNNPFQRRYGSINNDLCVGTDSASGDCVAASCTASNESGDCLAHVQSGSCLTYSYDLDLDGRIGVRACDKEEDETDCPRPVGSPSASPLDAAAREPYAWRSWYPPDEDEKTKDIEMEMFGFRQRRGGIDMRVGWYNKKDISFGCNSGRWEGMTSREIQVTDLAFTLTTLVRNTNPEKSRTDTCESGDTCQHIRTVGIRVSARLAEDPSVRQTLTALVAVRNDRYVLIP